MSTTGRLATDKDADVLECVINVSEGRDEGVLAALTEATGHVLLDVHRDADHHRSVFTLAGSAPEAEAGARRLAAAAVATLDLRRHQGVHPRLGTVDVVPWVALRRRADGRLVDGDPAAAVAARDRFARWAAGELGVPCFLYGPSSPDPDLAWDPPEPRRLPDLRRKAWRSLPPDLPPDPPADPPADDPKGGGPAREGGGRVQEGGGPAREGGGRVQEGAGPAPEGPHPRAGAMCVGARPLLVAYNVWLADPELAAAKRIAASLRSPAVRTLGLQVGAEVQVSCNLVDPLAAGPADVYDAVAAMAPVARAELVGLLPLAVLDAVPSDRWAELDIGLDRTIEARLAAGLDGGRR